MDIVTLDPKSLKFWQENNLEHLRYEYPDLRSDEICLDIGSYKREWGSEMEKRYGVKVEYFDALDNRAAWTYNGKLLFGGAYYYTTLFDDGNQSKTWYECVDIAPFLQEEIAVLKINIEGGEYELLNYILMMDLMKNVRHLQVQFHQIATADYKGMYEAIAAKLSETHELKWRYPYCWESWTRK